MRKKQKYKLGTVQVGKSTWLKVKLKRETANRELLLEDSLDHVSLLLAGLRFTVLRFELVFLQFYLHIVYEKETWKIKNVLKTYFDPLRKNVRVVASAKGFGRAITLPRENFSGQHMVQLVVTVNLMISLLGLVVFVL